jgi:hypothetical protein
MAGVGFVSVADVSGSAQLSFCWVDPWQHPCCGRCRAFWARVIAVMEIAQDVRIIRCSTTTERASQKGFSLLRYSGNTHARAMKSYLYQFIHMASRGALQAVLVRQPEKA